MRQARPPSGPADTRSRPLALPRSRRRCAGSGPRPYSSEAQQPIRATAVL